MFRTERCSDERTIITLPEKIDITNSDELKQCLLTLYQEGFKFVELNFQNVSSIDSSGLGKLLLFQKKFAERQGGLRIINITSNNIKNMFKMIRLADVIDYETDD